MTSGDGLRVDWRTLLSLRRSATGARLFEFELALRLLPPVFDNGERPPSPRNPTIAWRTPSQLLMLDWLDWRESGMRSIVHVYFFFKHNANDVKKFRRPGSASQSVKLSLHAHRSKLVVEVTRNTHTGVTVTLSSGKVTHVLARGQCPAAKIDVAMLLAVVAAAFSQQLSGLSEAISIRAKLELYDSGS
jgi:hypothetical protein